MTLDDIAKKYAETTDAILMCGEKQYSESVLTLLYSAIDALSWLYSGQMDINKRDVGKDYRNWVIAFLLPYLHGYDLTAKEIYLARCSLLHTYSAVAKHQDNNRIVAYAYGDKENMNKVNREELPQIELMSGRKFVILHIGDLAKGFMEGTNNFFKQVEENKELTVKHQCELLDLRRSTAYYQNVPVEVSQEEIAIKNAIDKIHFLEPSYGVRRIRNELRKQGLTKIGRRLIKRYMDEMDIHVFYPGPNLSKRDKKSKVYPYLLRNLKIDRPNQVWAIDITYVGTPCGFAYMVAIIDWYSRFIVGWAISNTLQTDFVVRAVKEAISKYGKPEIINSDQGSQVRQEVA